MDSWGRFVRSARDHHGVGSPALAAAAGVARSTYVRRIRREGWERGYGRTVIAPWANGGTATRLASLLLASGPSGAAAGWTAAWLYGLCDPPRRLDVVRPTGEHAPARADGLVRRAAWLRATDIVQRERLAVLDVPTMVLSLGRIGEHRLRGLVIDALQRRLTTHAQLVDRVASTTVFAGRGAVREVLRELAVDRPESPFHLEVLQALRERGYAPEPAPRAIATVDGRGVTVDIALPRWKVAVEPEGDAYHRDRTDRRNDRRRAAQLASTVWATVPVDWQDWQQRRAWVFRAVDAAILRQVGLGVADPATMPPHLGHEHTSSVRTWPSGS